MKIPRILNINLTSVSRNDLLAQLQNGFLMPVNVDMLIKFQKDREFYQAYQQANWVVCDSKVVALCLRFLGSPIREVIPGSSFFPLFCEHHRNNDDIRIFLLGAAEGVAKVAMERINKRIGRKIVIGAHSPSFGFEKDDEESRGIVNLVNQSGANVLVVGCGAPKQEKWIAKYKSAMGNIQIFMALGATIDFEAGKVSRAPRIFQSLCLEWLYRLCKEPRRLWRRYLVDDLPFIRHVFRQKRGSYQNPFQTESI